MRIVGVIDLQAGRAVHARGGDRRRYEAVGQAAGVDVGGDPAALARAYARAGVRELYVADLDAIEEGPLQVDALERVAAAGLPLLLDAGVASLAAAERARRFAAGVVVGLETLPSWDALERIGLGIGGARTTFSLDLRRGVPLGRLAPGEAPADIAARAVAAGAGSVLVIDVAQVGMAAGPDIERLRAIRTAIPGVPLFAGGGVRNEDDLVRLSDCGCDGALVATALQRGDVCLRRE